MFQLPLHSSPIEPMPAKYTSMLHLEVVLPNSISYIGEDAFTGCDNLKFYTYENGDYLGNRNNRYVAYVKVNNLDNKNIILHDETRTIVSSALKEMEVINEITFSKNDKIPISENML